MDMPKTTADADESGAEFQGPGGPVGGTMDGDQVGLPDITGGLATEAATLGNADGALADGVGAASGAALEADSRPTGPDGEGA
jgi:hypothetical protein